MISQILNPPGISTMWDNLAEQIKSSIDVGESIVGDSGSVWCSVVAGTNVADWIKEQPSVLWVESPRSQYAFSRGFMIEESLLTVLLLRWTE